MDLFLLVGLGNPGPEYEGTRHNLGFELIDRIAAGLRCKVARWEHDALTGRAEGWGTPLLLAKPQTWMNLSGGSVAALARFYKIEPARILVMFDDADLPLGQIRVRPSGSAGGHRGLESILESLGTREVARLRLGIGRPEREDKAGGEAARRDREGMVGHVLKRFGRGERQTADDMLARAAEAAEAVVTEGALSAMNRFNRRPADPGRDDEKDG